MAATGTIWETTAPDEKQRRTMHCSPLIEAEMTKSDIRELSEAMGLRTARKAALPAWGRVSPTEPRSPAVA